MSSLTDLVIAILFSIINVITVVVLIRRRKESGVAALDWPIGIFSILTLMGYFSIVKVLYPDNPLFSENSVPVLTDIIRVLNMAAFIVIFLMAEYYLNERLHLIRFGIFVSLLSSMIVISLISINSDTGIKTNTIISFANSNSSLDEALFDILQFLTITELFYVYIIQFRITKLNLFKHYLQIFVLAIGIFWLAVVYELLEHFTNIQDRNAFMTGLPTFLLLMISYIKYPEFVYLTPSMISYLQITDKEGTVYFSTILKDEDYSAYDYLIGPNIRNLNNIVQEMDDEEVSTTVKLEVNNRYLLIETNQDYKIVLFTNRPTSILKRAMKHFLQEFIKEFNDQLQDFQGYILPNKKGVHPDELLQRCIPSVQSKILFSHADGEVTGAK